MKSKTFIIIQKKHVPKQLLQPDSPEELQGTAAGCESIHNRHCWVQGKYMGTPTTTGEIQKKKLIVKRRGGVLVDASMRKW